MEIGKKYWAIAEGYIPAYSNGPETAYNAPLYLYLSLGELQKLQFSSKETGFLP